jgi:hypothetical protein
VLEHHRDHPLPYPEIGYRAKAVFPATVSTLSLPKIALSQDRELTNLIKDKHKEMT